MPTSAYNSAPFKRADVGTSPYKPDKKHFRRLNIYGKEN